MELKKANLHMDQIKCQVNAQITLEEDKNISDRNPDAISILTEKGRILIEEIRPGIDMVSVKGKMLYDVLYISDEEQGRIYRIEGEIPWEEKIRAEGMDTLDTPRVKVTIEDLRSGLINSRKISIRALLNFCIEAKEIQDEEILQEITGAENIEIKKEPYMQSVLAINKNDILRIKEDLELPSTLPAIREVLWKYLDLEKWEIKTLEDKIGIQGELNLFLLYEGEGDVIRTYETRIPFSDNIECPGSNGCMVADITPTVNNWSINVKQDYDGEDRVLDVEMVLEIPIQLYEKRQMEMITDVYGTTQNVAAEYVEGNGKMFREKYQTKVKLAETMSLCASSGRVIQICHVEVVPMIEEARAESGNLLLEGVADVRVFYMTDKEEKPYEILKKEIPFSYTLENIEITPNHKWKVNSMVEQCSGIILDEDKVEVKMTIGLEILIADCWKHRLIKNIRVEPFSEEKNQEIPGILVYIPSKKEDLWEVGKKYAVSIESVKNINQLTKTEIEKGQKILLVKDLS